MALHGVELQVSLEVLGVEPRYGQTVAKSSLRRTVKKRGSGVYRRLVLVGATITAAVKLLEMQKKKRKSRYYIISSKRAESLNKNS